VSRISCAERMELVNGDVTPTQQSVAQPLPKVIHIPPSVDKCGNIFDRRLGSNESHLVALYAFLTGVVFSASLACALFFPSTPQCWLYLAFLAFFHFMEYYITAQHKPDTVTLDGSLVQGHSDIAFLFNNGVRYFLAQICGVLEFLLERHYFPHTKVLSQTTLAGIPLATD
jgi:hypothetical protein